MEMGGVPVHIICTNGDKAFEEEMKALLFKPFRLQGEGIYKQRHVASEVTDVQ